MTAEPALHIARDDTGADIDAACQAAADFLSAPGIAADLEDLRETPARMARAYVELFSARPLRLTTFADDEDYDELVLARAIPFMADPLDELTGAGGAGHECEQRVRDSGSRPGRGEGGGDPTPGGIRRPGRDVNVWDVSDMIQALVRGGRTVDTGRLADPSVPLDQVTG